MVGLLIHSFYSVISYLAVVQRACSLHGVWGVCFDMTFMKYAGAHDCEEGDVCNDGGLLHSFFDVAC